MRVFFSMLVSAKFMNRYNCFAESFRHLFIGYAGVLGRNGGYKNLAFLPEAMLYPSLPTENLDLDISNPKTKLIKKIL